ncbi:MAG: hypothetical protein P8J32_06115 [bacterium]|nr:hypothetical protein [bacterium]
MTSKVVKKTKEELVVEWSGDKGFGILHLKYDEGGRYILDAEFLGIDTVLEIIKAI